ncbi:MAG TPA: nucleoside hydrolase-like domain-containing protein, partial [Anseongella sp.]|nr:nucleoside hydrolase-like domain-containing protein [Anseongella sp.]
YRGGDTSLVRSGWVQRHIRGQGPLGRLYPDYEGGDIWSGKLGGVTGIKEGDTPSFLGLICNGLNYPEKPGYASWGGSIRQDSLNRNHYRDAVDATGAYQTDPTPYLAGVYRWRAAFQADFRARLDWCVSPYAGSNHPPAADEKALPVKPVKAGEKITLKAGNWRDPDGDRLRFRWELLREAEAFPGPITIEAASERTAYFTAPATEHPEEIHILLTVMDNGKPSLYRYRRFIFRISP